LGAPKDGSAEDTRPDRGSLDERPGPGLEAEGGSPDDFLYVYCINADRSLQGPIWKQYLKNGLNAPAIPLFKLFKQFKDAVEVAASQASAKQGTP
jgi:hypothetical protein